MNIYDKIVRFEKIFRNNILAKIQNVIRAVDFHSKRSYYEVLFKFGAISFHEYASNGSLKRWSYLQIKERQSEFHPAGLKNSDVVSMYDPVIIERTVPWVSERDWPFYSLV